MKKVSQSVDNQFQDYLSEALSALEQGASLRDFTDMGDETMETIYRTAYSLYQGNQYEKAQKVFRFLCLYDHLEKKYFMGLGACCQMLGQWQAAIESYHQAAILDLDDPYVPFHTGHCYVALKDFAKAADSYRAAHYFAEKKPETHKLAAQAKLAEASMLKKQSELEEQASMEV